MNYKVLLIIPAYNEEKNIIKTCKKIDNYNKKNNTNFDYIVINDGSKDKTEELLISNNINHIKLIHNLGIGGAVQTGYKYGKNNNYDIAIQYDGDGQHDISYVNKIIEPILKSNIDMVVGSRFIDKKESEFQSSFARRVGIKLISFAIKIKTKYRLYDTTSGFRACNKKVIQIFSENYPSEYPEPISTVNVLLNKYKIKEIAVSMNERTAGVSSISSWKNIYYMVNVVLSIIVMKKVKK